MRICAHDFQRHGDAFGTTENACFRAFNNPQITISPTSLFSANFNGNRVKNHPRSLDLSAFNVIELFALRSADSPENPVMTAHGPHGGCIIAGIYMGSAYEYIKIQGSR